MPSRTLLLLLLLTAGLLTPVSAGAERPAAAAAPRDERPNVVLIMTDDMSVGDLAHMPRTRRLIGGQGTTFAQGLSPNPMCCPARAVLLTGRESHNNGVRSNGGEHGGYGALPDGPRLPEWLQAAGYHTAMLGKHLNGFRAEQAAGEPGWDVLDALTAGVYSYRSFVTWDDGRLSRVRGGYVTDHLAERSREVIDQFEADDDAPFFLWTSHVAPHTSRTHRCTHRCWGPPIPEKQDVGSFAGTSAPTRGLPSYNRRNGRSRPPFLRGLPSVRRAVLDRDFQRRVEALQSVDRAVADTVRALRSRGELQRTLLVFTSDNGYQLGQFRYVGKRLAYEPSVRVPLLVRGPGVRPGAVSDQMATTADLSRTFADVAGVVPPVPVDGVSLTPALQGGSTGRGVTILQTGAQVAPEGDGEFGSAPELDGWLYRGFRDDRWTYVRYPDPAGPDTPAFEELYDRRRDPYQLRNLALDPEYDEVLAEARRRADELATCAGATCHPGWEPLRTD